MEDEIEMSTPENLDEVFRGLNKRSLANLRCEGRGPRYYRRGRRIFYRIEDVRAWLMENPIITADQNELAKK